MSTKETPYCQKMQLLDNGEMVAVPDSKGNPIIVQLSESDPDYDNYKNGGSSKSSKRSLYRREDPSNACHCQWSFT